MNLRIFTWLLFSCALLQGCGNGNGTDEEQPADTNEVSYAIGFNLGNTIRQQDDELNMGKIVKGFIDGYTDISHPQMTQNEMRKSLMTYAAAKQKFQVVKQKQLGDKNAQEGKTFLTANKRKPGVVELDSGLQYKVVESGFGPTPTREDTVVVEYTGKFLDGEVFSSSKDQGKPATFKVTQVIPGWTEALQKMKAGATWEIYVPAELAYGERGASTRIGPNQTLHFTIHLVSIKDQVASPTTN